MTVAATNGGHEGIPALAEIPLYSPDSLLGQIDIVGTREGGLLVAHIPIELIYGEDVPVDEEHVLELADSMELEARKNGGTGQLLPILVGEIPEFGRFVTIDGFHRTPALQMNGINSAYGIVRPNCSWEEAYDLRIRAARSHKSVQFARIVEWMDATWRQTSWAEKLDADQAFRLTNINSSGKGFDLSLADAAAIKVWVAKRCEEWKLSPTTVMNHLDTARKADPNLVKEARGATGGHELLYITPGHLKVIVDGLAYKHDIQREVAAAAKSRNLRVPATRALVQLLEGVETAEEAQEVIARIDWKNLKPAHSKNRTAELRKQAAQGGLEGVIMWDLELVEQLYEDAVLIGKLLVQNAVIQRRFIPHTDQDKMLTEAVVSLDPAKGPPIDNLSVSVVKGWLPRLPSAERRLAVLHNLFGLSALAISQILGQYPDSIRNQLANVREKFGQSPEAQPIEVEPSKTEGEPSDTEPAPAQPPLPVEALPNIKFGLVEISASAWTPSARNTGIIRIQNLNAVNERTAQIATQYNLQPNEMIIDKGGRRVTLNGHLISGPLETELINVLLASYMCKPVSLDDAHTFYGLGQNLNHEALTRRLANVHKTCLLLAAQGIVFYNPSAKNGLGLKPLLVQDKRPVGKAVVV